MISFSSYIDMVQRQHWVVPAFTSASCLCCWLIFRHARASQDSSQLQTLLVTSQCAALDSADSSTQAASINASDVAHWMSRVLSAFLFLGIISTAAFGYKHVDSLPALFRRLFRQPVDAGSESTQQGNQHTLSKQLAYQVDVWFSTNRYSKILALLYLTVALVFMGALGIRSVSQQSFYSAVWEAIAGVGIDWTFASHAEEGSGHSLSVFLTRIMALLLSLGGLLVTALMLGIVSETIGHKIEEMRKGKSEVLETDHTLILGWSDKVASIVDQMALANESEGGRPIVILAEHEKEDMEAELEMQGINFRGSHVVCRKGSPLMENDLKRVSVRTARAIIVLSTCESADQSDARVLRTVLSLMGEDNRLSRAGQQGLRGHIVAELADIDNEPLVGMVGGDKIYTVTSHDIIGRLMIQCARQPGLAAVWDQVMGFCGDEFYMKEWPQLEGRTFGDILLMFQHAVPMGVKPAGTKGVIRLNPPDEFVLRKGDELLVLAEDDDTYAPSAEPAAVRPGVCPSWRCASKAERLLFVGWRRDLDDLILVLDRFVAPGSELHLYNEVPIHERETMLMDGGLDAKDLQNLTLVYKEPMMQGDVVDRKHLEDLCPEQFTSILILSDDNLGTVDSDSRCIAASLLLRDIQAARLQGHGSIAIEGGSGDDPAQALADLGRCSLSSRRSGLTGPGPPRLQASESLMRRLRHGKKSTVIISEILESRAKRLVSGLGICEIVLSNELVSMALAMVAENPDVIAILSELFTEDGNELFVVPVDKFLREGETLSFFDLTKRARQKAEILVGYKLRGVARTILNPSGKSRRDLCCRTVESFVVLSENEN